MPANREVIRRPPFDRFTISGLRGNYFIACHSREGLGRPLTARDASPSEIDGMLRIFRCGAGALMNLAPNDPGWMGVIVSVPYKRGRRSVPVSAAEAHLRYGLGCRCSTCRRTIGRELRPNGQ